MILINSVKANKGNFPLAECYEISGKWFSHTPLGTSGVWKIKFIAMITVKPWFTNTSLIQTPHFYGHFSLSLEKALTFSLTSTNLRWTPINGNSGHLLLAQLTDSHLKSTLVMQTLCDQLLAEINLPFFKIKNVQLWWWLCKGYRCLIWRC